MKSKRPLSTCFFLLGLVFHLTAQITIESGVELTILSGETITIEGNLDNAGTISGKGLLNVAGDYTNTGALAIIIGPDQSTHTTINVMGTFTPGGNFTVSNDSYTPISEDQAIIVQSGSTVNSFFSNTENNSWFGNYNLPNSGDFTITYSSVLPVELISFSGKSLHDKILLEWETASEFNNKGFDIEHSEDGKDWKKIGFLEGQGSSTYIFKYQYQDKKPSPGTNYYRLKQIDFNDVFDYSKVIAIEFNNWENYIKAFPNPSNGLINLKIVNPVNQRIEVSISDHWGRKMWESKPVGPTPVWKKEINIQRNGIYYLTVQLGNNIHCQRVIITN